MTVMSAGSATDAGAGHHGHRSVREPVLDLAPPVELQRGRADDDGRVRVVGLERRERLHGLAETLLVGEEQAPRLERVGDAGALERAQLAAEPVLDVEVRGVVRARAADAVDRLVVLAPQPVHDLARVRRHLDAVGAQVVLERLQQVWVDGKRAAVGLARRQREEGGDRLRVPVDVEREARLADALDQRERGRRRLLADLQPRRAAQGALIEPGAGHLQQLVGDLAAERQPVAPVAVDRHSRQRLRQLAGDLVEREMPGAVHLARGHAPDPAAHRARQPRLDLGRHGQRRVLLEHALHVRRRGVGTRRPPLLGLPVEPAARDRAHGVDDVGPVREREHHGLLPVLVEPQLDVVDRVGSAHANPPR